MNNRFVRWCKGYVEIEIKGANKERFINLCSNNKLCIYEMEKKEDIYTFSMDIESYKKIKKIAKKTHVFPRIYNRCGLPFILQHLEQRKSFTVGVLIGIFIFYICSLFIWDIKIEGENYYTDYELLNYLETRNIKNGMRVKDVVCKNIEDSIRKKYSDIGWVSAQVKGTRLIISIKENIKFENKNVSNRKKRHIVSSVDGIVKSIVVKQGEPIVNVGDTVKKGQILVSGIKEIKNDAGEVIKKYGVYSEADITIANDREYYYELEKQYKKQLYTGRKKIKWNIIINNSNLYTIHLPSFGKKIDNFDVIVNNYNVSLDKNLPLPIEINKYTEREYKLGKANYTKKQLLEKAKSHYKNYRDELKKEKVTIINSNIENVVDDIKIYSRGYVTLLYTEMEYMDVKSSELEVTTELVESSELD